MQKIPLKLAQPGMKLARSIEREDGLTLFAEGAELTQAAINRLAGMHIERVVVKGNPVALEGGGASVYDERLGRLDHLFRSYSQDKWMRRVKAFMVNYFKLKAAAEAALLAEEMEDEFAESDETGGTGEV